MKVLCEINDNDEDVDFVLWMFLSVFTAWMEKVVSVNCVSVGGRMVGGSEGRVWGAKWVTAIAR